LNVHELRYLSLNGLKTHLGSRSSRLLGRNTWVEAEDASAGVIGIRFHATRILTFYPNGSFKVSSGGWRTSTTKQRINAFLPPRFLVFAKKGEWYIDTPSGIFPFQDGATWPPPQQLLFEDA
jgi:hypothetical protein